MLSVRPQYINVSAIPLLLPCQFELSFAISCPKFNPIELILRLASYNLHLLTEEAFIPRIYVLILFKLHFKMEIKWNSTDSE